MDLQNMYDTAKPALIAVGLKVLGAIALYIVGRWLIGLAGTLIQKSLERQKVEPTIIRYIGNAISVALNILLVIGILGYFGVETTSFAALIAALGIAIGAAWGGLLSNFAAGAFILVLRPFKVGDYVLAATSKAPCARSASSSPRSTARTTCRPIVGNAKVMNGTIKNFSAQSVSARRADRAARSQRRSGRRGSPAEGCAAEDRQRHGRPGARRRDPDVQRARAGARRAAVRAHRSLLAGLLRHQSRRFARPSAQPVIPPPRRTMSCASARPDAAILPRTR